jgi:NAD(P)-dependent dehydrogenase (short-subunit alcohol dehydrogenase family)
VTAPFDGAAVLVTGAGSGIGAATCEVLAAEGWEPVPIDLDPPAGGIALDVTDEAAWESALDDVGPLRGLVTCAGIRTRGDIVDTSAAEFRRHLDVNVVGTWLAVREYLRRHTNGEPGAIVTIASVNATIAVAGQAHYIASKGAVAALTKAVALEGAPLGVRANAIGPGPIRTPMTEERLVQPAQVAWLEDRVPLGRVGEPAEIGRVAEFLLSDAASYVTGEVIYVDGGWVANGA